MSYKYNKLTTSKSNIQLYFMIMTVNMDYGGMKLNMSIPEFPEEKKLR